jgi:hypothetical protein
MFDLVMFAGDDKLDAELATGTPTHPDIDFLRY